MMKRKMVMTLNDSSQQRKALKAVSTLHGIDAIAADLRDGRITVTGVVDPVDVVGKLRRLFGNAEIVSVWPANDSAKKDDDKKKAPPRPPRPPRPPPPYPCPYPCPYPYPYPYPYPAPPPPPPPRYEFTVGFLNSITDNFSEERIIGRGRHGVVYKGVQGNGVCIAVKKLHLMPGLDNEEFINEFHNLVYGLWVNRMQSTISKHTSCEVRTCIEIALKCVESSQVKRPTINQIIQRLNKIDTVECSSIGELYRTREFAFEFLERITNDFSDQNKVGSGGYGDIYKGVLDNGEEIAVKKLHHHQMLFITDKQFKNEVINLMRVQHENIVRLVGYCHHTSQIFVEYEGKHVSASVVERAICLEYMQGGSLDDQLSAESCKLDWDKCYKIIKGICEGLHYLHNSVNPIYHLDLKPANILLDKDMVAKIGDFGLSRLFDSAQTYITASRDLKGTFGYMPPEYINGQIISPKFDVFSLGVIIIQIMAGKEGYFNCQDTHPKDFIEHVHEKWRVRLQATMSSHVSEEVRTCIEIALKCVEYDRNQRPKIAQIVNELSNIGIAKSSPVGQVQATISPHVSEEVRTCIEIVLKCVEDDRTRRPTIAQIVNELSKIGIAKGSPINQISQATFSSPQQMPQPEQGGSHEANKLTGTPLGETLRSGPGQACRKLNLRKWNVKLKLKRKVILKLKRNVN